MNTILNRTPLFARTSAWASLWRLAVVFAICLAALAQPASATTYDVYGGTKPTWPSTWQTLPGLVSSAVNSSLSGNLSRLDFVGDATYPTAFYTCDANYAYFRVRINADDPAYPSSAWTHTIMLLIDKNGDNVPDSAFSWDTKGSGTDHQLELNMPDSESPNYTTTLWNKVNMIDRDGSNSTKTRPDFNTITGHTNDGFVRLVSLQTGPAGANTTTFVDFAVKWSYLTGTYNSSAISPLAPGQTWRVQFGSINDGTDHVNINADVAGSATLTTTLGTVGAWSDSINPTATYTWTGGAGGGDLNWNTAANWDAGAVPVNGCDIIFPAVDGTLVNPANNIGAGLALHSVTVTGTGYTISGNAVTISAGMTNSSGALSAFNCPITLTAGQTWDLGGNTTFGGTIGLGTFALAVMCAADKTSEFQNIVSGTGTGVVITKSGAGVLKMFGVNSTYVGKTLVIGGTLFIDRERSLGAQSATAVTNQLELSGGTLQVNNNLTIGANITNLNITLGASGGTFLVDDGVDFEVKKILSGTGNLIKTGPGMMKISTATNTYTGKTIVSGGTLAINNEVRLGANPATTTADQLTIQNGAKLNIFGVVTIDDAKRGITLGSGGGIVSVDEGVWLEVKNVITGAGSLTKTGVGSLKLSTVNNTYTGKTIVTEGILMINSETRLGNNPESSTADQLTISGGATLEAFGSFAIDDSNRGMLLGPGGGMIVVDDGFTLTVAKPIGDASGGNALTKAGTGTLTLSATSTYSGVTTVSEGRLNVDGLLASGSAVTVAYGATLGGTGTAAGTIDANGTLAPGNAIGTLNTGAESWNNGGSYEVQINDAIGAAGTDPGWDLLNLSGGLAIAADSGTPFIIKVVSLSGGSSGSAAHFDNTQSYTWRIATAAGGVTGFDVNKLTIDDSGFQNAKGSGQFTITQSGNDVYLQFASPLIASPITLGRGWGTFLRIPVASVLPNTSGGTGERNLYSVTSRDQDYVQISGAYILFAPTGNATRILDYTVADSAIPTAHTTSSTITVTVTNAVGLVNDVSSTGGGVTIRLAGIPGFNYAVERSSSASDWTGATTVQTLQAPTAGVWTFTDPAPPNPSFYRLRQNN